VPELAAPNAAARPPTFAVIGATGRVGRALQRAVGVGRLAGMARRAPADAPDWQHFGVADRRDVTSLRAVLDGADVAVDLCAFTLGDMSPLLEAWAACARPPRLLLLASSLAERAPERWSTAISPENGLRSEVAPADPYGAGKRSARLAAEATIPGLGGHVITLLLPQLLAIDDPAARERTYLRAARDLGAAQLPGDGQQRPCVVASDDVAHLLVALASAGVACLQAAGVRTTVLQVAPRRQPSVATLVSALLAGAGLPGAMAPHPEPSWRGPHSGADEVVDASRLRQWLPGLAWIDLEMAYRDLGARWSAGG